MNVIKVLILLFTTVTLNCYLAVASENLSDCGGYGTIIFSNNEIDIFVCHAPYTKIKISLLHTWQSCDDANIYIHNKENDKTTKYLDCNPTLEKQISIKKDLLLVRHLFHPESWEEVSPLVIETYNIKNKSKKYELVAKLPIYTKTEITKAIAEIEETIEKPFDGMTYFKSIYGSFFKLRSYSAKDPEFVLSILKQYLKRKVFDGEASEILWDIIQESELISFTIKQH